MIRETGLSVDHNNGLEAKMDKFGRYPHRNSKKGRKSTKEEQEWLVIVED